MNTLLAPLIEAFFTKRLYAQRQASPNTVSSYRHAFRLLLRFAMKRLAKEPSKLLLTDLDATFIGAFLEYIETERKNCARTRNARLAAIRSFFGYVAPLEPAHGELIRRVLAIQQKRADRNIVCFLTETEIDAMLGAPNKETWIGRRDHALLVVGIQTGLRVSELVGLTIEQLVLENGPHIRCYGKGRKERCTPLTPQAVRVLKAWLHERKGTPPDPVFPSRRGSRLSRDAVERLILKYADSAGRTCSSLRGKRVTPHVLRHTTAVLLLRAGVDISVIALWLGHETMETTQIYLEADLSIKEEALRKTAPLNTKPGRYKPDDELLAFLEAI